MGLDLRAGPSPFVLRRLVGLVALCVVVSGWGLTYLSGGVRAQIEDLATDTADTIHWTLAQSEVEFLRTFVEVQALLKEPDGDLAQLRRRFDVLFSRMTILAQATQFEPIRNDLGSVNDLAIARSLLDQATLLIDAPDAELRAQMQTLASLLAQMSLPLRRISLHGLEILSAQSDQHRHDISSTLTGVAMFALWLIVVLAVLVAALLYLVSHTKRGARVQEQISTRMQAMVETSLDAILVVDGAGRVLEFNGAATRIFGYSRQDAVGGMMADLLIPDHLRAAHEEGMHRFLTTGEKRVLGAGRVQLEAKRKDGTIFPAELSISLAPNATTTIFVAYLRDISKRVAAQTELIEARDKALAGERAKASLLAVMSHEMRTPLNGLLGTLELLEDSTLDPHQRELVEIMETSGQLLLGHVNDVLDITRLDQREIELVAEPFDLPALLQDMVKTQRDRAEKLGNTITLTPLDPSIHHVIGDAARLRQILLNLLGNAVKFTQGGSIWLEAERLDNGQIAFHVIDTGPGIAEEELPRIFNDFVTLDASYQRQADGTGLGLGIVRRLVKAMGGTFGVESVVGEGSLFWVHLPLAQTNQSVESPLGNTVAQLTPPTESLSVLLVEDNPINRLVAREMLEKSGHIVTEAENGRIGAERAEAERFDVILMDISMPELDGVLATQRLRQGVGPNRNTPIIALTAHAMPQELARFRDAGMSEILTKPISRAALHATLSGAVPHPVALASDKVASVLDLPLLAEMIEDFGVEHLGELVAKFRVDTTARLETLRHTLAQANEPAQLAAQLHQIAGAAAIFGAAGLRDALQQFEHSVLGTSPPAPKDIEATLDALWIDTEQALKTAIESAA